MRLRAFILLAPVAFLIGGCISLPSGWRLGGSPLDKVERKQTAQEVAEGRAVVAAQASIHKAGAALAAAPASRPVAIATDFVAEAQALLDQAKGAPTAGDLAQWRDLVARLLSDNVAIRTEAEHDRASQAELTARLADKLAAAAAETERAQAKAMTYARESEATADWLRKLYWIGLGLGGLWILGQVLAVAGRFFPALSGVSRIVNGVAAPALTWAYGRAESGLQRVGQAIADARRDAPAVAEQIVSYLDPVTDADHQATIRRGATTPPAIPTA